MDPLTGVIARTTSMTSFSCREQPGSSSDPVYSRILDARWAEVALARLKEESDFLEKKSVAEPVGSQQTQRAARATQEEPKPKPRPRPPKKPKNSA